MSENFFVSVLKVISFNSDILNAPERIFKDILAFITYDSQGVKARFTKRDKENGFNDSQHILEDDDNSILLDLLLTKKTNVTKKRDVHIIHTADELAFIKFANNEHDRKFDKILKDLKGSYNNSVFLQRTEESSASQYFQFYGYLSQQQNMMQDFVRTSTYQKAIHGNFSDFNGKIVLDVGAGSGILSFFAVQAGAAKVYAVEASNMAQYAQQLVASNNLSERIEVIAGKIEEIELPQKVDIIISEPMGYMLFNERMLETYLHAKKWLKPNGKMFPSRGDLHVAPFCDEALYMEQFNKANFWYQTSFHNVDLSNLRNAAMKEYFQQPIVDTFDIRICLAKSIRHVVDFLQADEFDLHNINIPLEFHMLETGTVHGLAFWFDVEFVGSTSQIWLSTSPTEPLTHWYQVRCLLQNPIFVKQGQLLTGRVILIANKRQSYDVTIELNLEGTQISSHNTLDIKNPYFRYTGGPVQAPPGTNTQSPSETYWSQLDSQATRTAVNLINGISINGLGEVNLDMPQTIINPNLIGNQGQQQQQIQYQNINPNIHTGLISSTGRNPTFPASNHHNSTFSNQMDTSNGKPDEKAQVYDIGAGTTQPAAGAHSMDTNGKSGTATTFIDTTMLNAMQAMFSPPMHNASQIQVQQQQQQQPQQQQQQYSQQFHPHLKHQMFQHPTTAATSTPQLYFN